VTENCVANQRLAWASNLMIGSPSLFELHLPALKPV